MKFKIIVSILISLLGWACTTSTTQTYSDSTAIDASPIETADVDDSSKMLVLKWKGVSTFENGNWFEFTDESGHDFHADRVDISGFSEEENDYFTRTPVEGTPLSQYKIKEATKEKWFEVKVVTIQEENDAAGDGSMKDVVIIVGIKPH